jgi:hypothetical protein
MCNNRRSRRIRRIHTCRYGCTGSRTRGRRSPCTCSLVAEQGVKYLTQALNWALTGASAAVAATTVASLAVALATVVAAACAMTQVADFELLEKTATPGQPHAAPIPALDWWLTACASPAQKKAQNTSNEGGEGRFVHAPKQARSTRRGPHQNTKSHISASAKRGNRRRIRRDATLRGIASEIGAARSS